MGSVTSITYKARCTPRRHREGMNEALNPPFGTKFAVAIRDDLMTWQRLNVAVFLASGVAAANPQLVGQPYEDADAQQYLALLGLPALIFAATAEELRTARKRAVRRDLPLAICTEGMFRTGHDAANRSVVAAVPGDQLHLVGIALHGPKNVVDRVMKGMHLHP